MSAAMSVFMLMASTQLLGAEQAGIFSLAYANAQQFQVLGSYEMRTFQVTDNEGKYSFGTYYSARLITCFLMVVLLIGYSGFVQNSLDAVLLFVAVGLIRFLDAFEDVFHGMFQKRGRLDIAGKALFIRTLVTTASFVLGIVVFRDLILASVMCAAISFAVILVIDVFPARNFESLKPSWNLRNILTLLWDCTPIFLGSFFAMYLANAPKYGLQVSAAYEYQTYYSIIFMPAMVINLLCGFVFRPLLTDFADAWGRDLPRFRKLLMFALKLCLLAFGAIFLIAFAIGAPVLSFVYGVDVNPYRAEMLLLLAGGLLNAFSVVLYYALTTMRKQVGVLIGYGLAALYAVIFGGPILEYFGFTGAAFLYDSSFLVLVIVFGVITTRSFLVRSNSA